MRRRILEATRAVGGPVVMGVLARGGVLVQVVVASWALPRVEANLVVVAIAVSSAVQVLGDSGAVQFASITPLADTGRSWWNRLTLHHLSVGLLGVAVATGIIAMSASQVSWSDSFGLLALPVACFFESAVRLFRVPALLAAARTEYALGDGAVALARLVGAGSMALAGSSVGLWAGAACAAAASVLYWRRSLARLAAGVAAFASQRQVFLEVQRYGVPSLGAGIYSQAPAIVLAAAAPLDVAAAFAFATRFVQPLEVVAATASQALLPRLAARRSGSRALLVGFGGLGLVTALVAAGPVVLVLRWLDAPAAAAPTALVLLAGLAIKFVNYAVAAELTARQMPLVRLRLTLSVAAASVVVLAVTSAVGTVAVACGIVLCETLLATAGVVILRRTGAPAGPSARVEAVEAGEA